MVLLSPLKPSTRGVLIDRRAVPVSAVQCVSPLPPALLPFPFSARPLPIFFPSNPSDPCLFSFLKASAAFHFPCLLTRFPSWRGLRGRVAGRAGVVPLVGGLVPRRERGPPQRLVRAAPQRVRSSSFCPLPLLSRPPLSYLVITTAECPASRTSSATSRKEAPSSSRSVPRPRTPSSVLSTPSFVSLHFSRRTLLSGIGCSPTEARVSAVRLPADAPHVAAELRRVAAGPRRADGVAAAADPPHPSDTTAH